MTLRDRLENHLCRTEVGGDLSPGQIAEAVDAVLAFLAAEPVSEEAVNAAIGQLDFTWPESRDHMGFALAVGWRAMLGVKP